MIRTLRQCVLQLGSLGTATLLALTLGHAAEPPATPSADYLCIRGIYPHLAAFNSVVKDDGATYGSGGECGIGAVVPWAGKL